MGKNLDKTNVMRVLDKKKLQYQYYTYDSSIQGAEEVAECLGQEQFRLYKTLVTVGKSKEHYVFMVPGGKKLDLKKAAKAAGEKSLEMILQKDLLPLTGYIHGGCSPIGMKKQYKTFIDLSASKLDTIFFSAGRVGFQVEMKLADLQQAVPVVPADITIDTE